jgi:sugar/nucleoside kinase (ribokinase family)
MDKQVIVAGHICLDVIPEFTRSNTKAFVPGSLHQVGPSIMETGGAVANTGLALHRLGFKTRLIGKIGKDFFGKEILKRLENLDPFLSDGMIIQPDTATSYTIVINPPGTDRIFLHCPGANDSFSPEDIMDSKLENIDLFHFGYPPLMKRMFEGNGRELTEIFQRMKEKQLTTSLDMALPDPSSEAGKTNWRKVLIETLPYVDLFLPSLEEILFMVGSEVDRTSVVDQKLLSKIADELLQWGTAIVCIKLGESGLYVKTTSDRRRLEISGIGDFSNETILSAFVGREFIVPCFDVHVKGTTGAGDCTIAGFLGGIMKGLKPEQAGVYACAVGAYCVEKIGAISNIPNWEDVKDRIHLGWKRLDPKVKMENFIYHDGVYVFDRIKERTYNGRVIRNETYRSKRSTKKDD